MLGVPSPPDESAMVSKNLRWDYGQGLDVCFVPTRISLPPPFKINSLLWRTIGRYGLGVLRQMTRLLGQFKERLGPYTLLSFALGPSLEEEREIVASVYDRFILGKICCLGA